jgi:hypothetical protein
MGEEKHEVFFILYSMGNKLDAGRAYDMKKTFEDNLNSGCRVTFEGFSNGVYMARFERITNTPEDDQG